MKADYELRHKLYGQQGSMWERQVTAETRTQLRKIVKTAGNASTLTELDQTAASALNEEKVLVEDVYFDFVDGNFAVVGQHQSDYEHHSQTVVGGLSFHVAYRSSSGVSKDTDPIPTRLARVTSEFIRSIEADAGSLTDDRDWYLVPVGADIIPLVIEGREEDVYLVNGIDFVARDGYIVMTDDPATVLPSGLVKIPSAYKKVNSPNSFVLSAPRERRGSRYLAEYARRSQALKIFKRAAAEYAGLYVLQDADVVLSANQLDTNHWVYNLASAGPVEIRYPHKVLLRDQQLLAGHIVSDTFEVSITDYNSDVNAPRTLAMSGWNWPISLDGILPVNGLSWDGMSRIKIDSVETDPVSSKPYVRVYFDEAYPADTPLAKFWSFSRTHEAHTQVFLHDGLGQPDMPSLVDFWDILGTFYGSQLILVLFGNHTPTINSRMHRFLLDHRPESCTMLYSVRTDIVGDVMRDFQGIPLVDDAGDYIPFTPPACEQLVLSVRGNLLAIDNNLLTYEVCS